MDFQEALRYLDEHASYHKTGRIDSPSTEVIEAILLEHWAIRTLCARHSCHGNQWQGFDGANDLSHA